MNPFVLAAVIGLLLSGCSTSHTPVLPAHEMSHGVSRKVIEPSSGPLLPGEHDPLKIVQGIPSRGTPVPVPLVKPLMEHPPEAPFLCRWFGWKCAEFYAGLEAAKVRRAEEIVQQSPTSTSRTVPIRPKREQNNF